MKNITLGLATAALLSAGTAADACPLCRPLVNAGVYNAHFAGHLLVTLLPVAVLLGVGAALQFVDSRPGTPRG